MSLFASPLLLNDELAPNRDATIRKTYASAHSCLLNSACFARFSALVSFVLLGSGSEETIDDYHARSE